MKWCSLPPWEAVPTLLMTSHGRGLCLGSKCVVEVIQVDIEPGESLMDGDICNMSEKGQERLTKAFGLGREPRIARVDLMNQVGRRPLILKAAIESEGF